MYTFRSLVFLTLLSAYIVSSYADDSSNTRVIIGPPASTVEEGAQLYAPIAKFLSGQTKTKWVYEPTRDWLSYVKLVVSDRADLTFSQAHFAGYLSLYHNHRLLVRAPDETDWVLVGKKTSDFRIVGRSVCLIPPPELGSLVLTSLPEYQDPMRMPHIVTMARWEDLVQGVNSDNCAYTVLPMNMIPSKSGQNGLRTRTLTRVAGPAVTTSSRVDDGLAEQIRNSLLSPAGQAATAPLREKFNSGKPFVALASTQPYLIASALLVEGYLVPMQRMDRAFKTVQARAEKATGINGREEWIARVDPMLVPDIRAVQQLANNHLLREAVKAQNSRGMTLAQIQRLDKEWMGTRELTPFKLSLQESETGTLLKQSVLLNPSYTELFVTDNQGANVAAYPATSDYWQGDEEKFTESFVNGGRVYVGKQKYDESTKKVALQVSVPVYDEQQRAIGVLVAGLVVDYLQWKKKQTVATTGGPAVAKNTP